MRQTMYCVERSDGPDQWVQEQCFKTEFKAFVNARAKSLAFTNVYPRHLSKPWALRRSGEGCERKGAFEFR